MEYVTANEMAEKWNISSRRIRILCNEGRVDGAIQKGNLWLIPDTAKKPQEFRRGRKRLLAQENKKVGAYNGNS
ncbi:hypothetical protein SAMN02910384_02356 [Pseudobutyrivibrio sp. ACV-2]|uniref:hypothetical protein n=1 Tax=Pseudobutyrivibrio sp. ACV-2 TaxID=1520801 RepID=UPI00089CCAD0|nr:hypothetical protein [Pseudobutyrivibrio sp. ACV-2]SEA79699.1 hypothetical protein SAMN02910384_02356 [Pseudobutyrivibrio sp. ACV-2]